MIRQRLTYSPNSRRSSPGLGDDYETPGVADFRYQVHSWLAEPTGPEDTLRNHFPAEITKRKRAYRGGRERDGITGTGEDGGAAGEEEEAVEEV